MHQEVWRWVGVCPIAENSDKWKKFAIPLFAFAVLAAHLSLIIASVMFAMHANYENALHSISLFTMIIASAYVLIVAFAQRHKVIRLFDMLSDIHRKCKT